MSGELASELAKAFEVTRERGGTVLPEPLVKGWMRDRGIPVPDGGVARTLREAESLAKRLYHPLVAKITSDRVLHKTELGGVITGIDSAEELAEAYDELAGKAGDVKGYLGILLEEQSPSGVEIIVGLQNDPHFGPVIMVGTGGIYTDLLEDVTFRMLPVGAGDVEAMLSELKGRRLLEGFRGSPRSDVDALCEVIADIASFGCEIAPVLESADFNPVIALPDGAAVVDAKVVIAPQVKEDPFAFDPPSTDDLAGFFEPESVAVVGASAGAGKIGNVIVDSLANYEFTGRIYPVNPRHEEILGVRCYPSLDELPETPELVVMVIDLAEGPRLMEKLAEMGVRNLLVVSGGGKELGGERGRIEREMADLSGKHGIRVLGPNCIGAFDGRTRFDSFFHSHDRMLRPPGGPMSFITQSGTWGCGFLEEAEVVGVSRMVSYGNRLDVDEGDLIEFLASDPGTKVIASYVEGLSEGRKFVQAARSAIFRHLKPVVVFKTGRTSRSAQAAVSHTGAYGGSYRVYEGVLEQAGIITADSFTELYACSKALALQPPAAGRRAAMVSNGAGPMVNAIDRFGAAGLELVDLRRASVEAMREQFSFFYLVENPVDVTGSASAADYEFVIRTLMSDENLDIIMPYFVFQDTPLDESIVERLKALNAESDKPLLACSIGGHYTRRLSNDLEAAGIPVMQSVNDWVAAAAALARWGDISISKGARNG